MNNYENETIIRLSDSYRKIQPAEIAPPLPEKTSPSGSTMNDSTGGLNIDFFHFVIRNLQLFGRQFPQIFIVIFVSLVLMTIFSSLHSQLLETRVNIMADVDSRESREIDARIDQIERNLDEAERNHLKTIEMLKEIIAREELIKAQQNVIKAQQNVIIKSRKIRSFKTERHRN